MLPRCLRLGARLALQHQQHQQHQHQKIKLVSTSAAASTTTTTTSPMAANTPPAVAAAAASPEAMAEAAAAIKGLRPVVTYHHPCVDGVFAALAAYNGLRRWGEAAGGGGVSSSSSSPSSGASPPPPRFVPLRVFEDPPSPEALGLDPERDAVVMLDYAGPPGYARSLAAHAAR